MRAQAISAALLLGLAAGPAGASPGRCPRFTDPPYDESVVADHATGADRPWLDVVSADFDATRTELVGVIRLRGADPSGTFAGSSYEIVFVTPDPTYTYQAMAEVTPFETTYSVYRNGPVLNDRLVVAPASGRIDAANATVTIAVHRSALGSLVVDGMRLTARVATRSGAPPTATVRADTTDRATVVAGEPGCLPPRE